MWKAGNSRGCWQRFEGDLESQDACFMIGGVPGRWLSVRLLRECQIVGVEMAV